MDLTKEIISRYYEKGKNETSEIPLEISQLRLKAEISYFLKFLEHLPREAYSLELVQSILDLDQAGLIKHSLTLFRETVAVLQENDFLTRHEFVYSLGMFYSKIADMISLDETTVDNIACRGMLSVDRKQPILNYVYINSKCPFCKQPVQTTEFIPIILDFTLSRSGLTLKQISKGEIDFIHKT